MTDGTVPYVRRFESLGALQLSGCHLVPEATVTKYILLVDDSEVVRIATRHFLESQPGFAVCGEAVDGLEAVEMARELQPDLIILDVAMPRLNGLEAARRLRAALRDTPIILFTWYADAIQPQDAAAAGVNAVVSKTNPVGLQKRINSLVQAA